MERLQFVVLEQQSQHALEEEDAFEDAGDVELFVHLVDGVGELVALGALPRTEEAGQELLQPHREREPAVELVGVDPLVAVVIEDLARDAYPVGLL